MIAMLKNLAATAASFLSSTHAPPDTPVEHEDRLKSLNHMESPKFYIVLTSVLILSFFYFTSVGILFVLPHAPEVVSGYVTLFSKSLEILAVIIASYVGAQAVVDLKYSSSSSASLEGTTNTQTIKEDITVIHTNAKDEDYELN